MDIDTSLLLGLIGVSTVMVLAEMKRNAKFMNLRDNFRTVTYGRFEVDDFIKKQ